MTKVLLYTFLLVLHTGVSAQEDHQDDVVIHGSIQNHHIVRDSLNSLQPLVQGETNCINSRTPIPPFYVSDTYKQGDKIYENFRDIEDESKVKKHLPKGSIVYTPPELFHLKTSSDFRLPVEVVSVPNEKLEKTLMKSRYYHCLEKTKSGACLRGEWRAKASYRRKIYGITRRDRVDPINDNKKENQGYLDKRSLKQVSDYVFILKNDAPLFTSPKGEVLNDKKISLKLDKEGNYSTRICCMRTSSEKSKKKELYCGETYLFEILDLNNQVIGQEAIGTDQVACSILPFTYPIPKQNSIEIANVLKLLKGYAATEPSGDLDYFNEDIELIRKRVGEGEASEIQLVKMPIDEEDKGPYCSYHYRKDDSGSSDAFLKPHAQCTFLQVLKDFCDECKTAGCQVQFGDMHHDAEWRVHTSHGDGECIDIRPFRKSSDDNVGLTYLSALYDREKTEKFIDKLIQAGAQNIYFNDKNLLNKYNSDDKKKDLLGENWADETISHPSKKSGHSNHIHFCFKESNARARKTCKSGVQKP